MQKEKPERLFGRMSMAIARSFYPQFRMLFGSAQGCLWGNLKTPVWYVALMPSGMAWV
jgi:hypothetical protein